MTDTYDVVVIGAGPASTRPAGWPAAACGSPSWNGSWSAGVLVLGLHPVQDPDPAGRRAGRGAARAGRRRGGHRPARLPAAFARRDYMTSDWHDDGQPRWLESKGIAFIRGTGRLTGERAVEVETADGAVRRLRAARAVVLATGSRAVVPPIPGWPRPGRGTTGRRPAPRRSRAGCSCSEAAPSGPSWPRRSGGSAARRSWSWRVRTGCWRARSRSPARSCAPRSRPRASPW